jgi:hypothetical protein
LPDFIRSCRYVPQLFQNGLDPDAVEGAAKPPYAFPNIHVDYVRVEPPGIPTAFWRGVGPTHNIFVVESFIDELAAAAKQDPVAYRKALLQYNPRALGVLTMAAEKAGWGQPLPARRGRGVSLQFAFGSYLSQVAEVEVAADGSNQGSSHRLRRRLRPRDQSGHDRGPGRRRFDLRPDRRAARRDHTEERAGGAEQFRHLSADADGRSPSDRDPSGRERRGAGRFRRGADRSRLCGRDQRDLRRHRQAHPHSTDRHQAAENFRRIALTWRTRSLMTRG